MITITVKNGTLSPAEEQLIIEKAEGWSTYADHILEEGQTPTRAMVAKFNAMKTDEPQDDMR